MTSFQIECFLVLAQKRNFTQAAEVLFMTQPALSRIILSLEQELRTQLFTRNARNVTLTYTGSAFLKECPEVLSSFRRCLEATAMAEQGYIGEIQIGTFRDTFDIELVEILSAINSAHPNIKINLTGCTHSDLSRLFKNGQFDIIFTGKMDDAPLDATTALISSHDQCVVVPLSSPFATRKTIKMEELREEKFVMMSRQISQPGFDNLLSVSAEAGFVPNVVAETENIPILLMMVACNQGITLLHKKMTYIAPDHVKFIAVEKAPAFSKYLVWSKNNENPSLKLFLEIAQDIIPHFKKDRP